MTQLLRDMPRTPFLKDQTLAGCIDACFECAEVCAACGDACLEVQNLVRCLRLTLDCADICETTGLMLCRQQQPDLELLRATVTLCRLATLRCAEECELHAADHEHCRICSDTCRRCEVACQRLLEAFGRTSFGGAAFADV